VTLALTGWQAFWVWAGGASLIFVWLGVLALCEAAGRKAPKPTRQMLFANRCPHCGLTFVRRVEPEECEWAERAARHRHPDARS
jgi:hypothetical protein